MHPKHAEYQAFPHPDNKSAQWESNPHFRHGKAVGCRYIMGAFASQPNCQTSISAEALQRAPSRNRTRITSLRRRRLSVRPSVLVLSGTGENRTHMIRFKRPMHYLVCHNPICFVVRSARKESNLQPSSYKDAALTTEPRAVSGAGEIRTLAERIKSPSCCQLHHNPEVGD